ncbi:molybdopterin-binding protein [Novosphingobium sp.]|uniref:molybdopterin-binding protein n=1 Tax=Novosphingobium sp. TaxID=1874826 RepID=UPI00262344F7|nr:molybdopterin-binding protein [Novosphingobium sp.]
MTGLDLLSKTELWVEDIVLEDVDLTRLALCAGGVLGLGAEDIFVTDVRDRRVVFDVVSPSVSLEAIAGKEAALLDALRGFGGVSLGGQASVHSFGVLGVIGAPAEQAADILANAAKLEAGLKAYVARSVVVLSTGGEVARGEIEDTNFAAAQSVLGALGFRVDHAGVVEDDEVLIAARLDHLLGEGYGLLITTGGVGAEDKDKTIEAMQRVAPDLSTAVLAQYQVGHGRHVKPHVRVACGRVGETVLVALPGPTREVLAALPLLAEALAEGQPPAVMAEAIAAPIRALWKAHKMGHGHQAGQA